MEVDVGIHVDILIVMIHDDGVHIHTTDHVPTQLNFGPRFIQFLTKENVARSPFTGYQGLPLRWVTVTVRMGKG